MGARVTSKSTKQQPEPEINVTPLVDVVLVLLIIFMVITPAISEGENVELPAIVNVDQKKEVDPIDVTLAPDGIVLFDKERIAEGALEAKLTAAFREDPERKVMLKADFGMPYAKVRETFVLAQNIGFKGVSLKVIQRKPAEAS